MAPPWTELNLNDLDPELSRVWKALASDDRRRILDCLRDRPMTTGEVVMLFPELSRFAVMQHLKVLVRANLIIVKRSGRERFNHLNVVPIQLIHDRWVSRYAGLWAGALTGLKGRVEGLGVDSGAVDRSAADSGRPKPLEAPVHDEPTSSNQERP